MKMWSGPGKALQEHLMLFEHSQRGWDFVLKHGGATRFAADVQVPIKSIPESLQKWATFAQSYGVLTDGETNAALSDLRQGWWSRHNMAKGLLMLSAEYQMLNEGVTHYVSCDIGSLVSSMAELALPEPLFPTDLPTPHGLVVLEQPIIISDLDPSTGVLRDDLPLPVRAIGWQTAPIRSSADPDDVKDGINFFLYSDPDSYNEVYAPAIEAAEGYPATRASGHRLMAIEFNPWGFGTIWSNGGHSFSTHDQQILSSVAYMRRWFLSLMRLLWQEILDPEVIRPDRPAKRRMERLSWSGQGDVKVLRLRRVYRPEHEADDGEERSWVLNHRYICRGHWRNQWYPSLGPAGDPEAHRMIWIMPHVRGPEDRPLIVKHAVTSVVR